MGNGPRGLPLGTVVAPSGPERAPAGGVGPMAVVLMTSGGPWPEQCFLSPKLGSWTFSLAPVRKLSPGGRPGASAPRAHPSPFGHVDIGAGGPAGRSRPVLTCFPSARFLLPSAQLSETLANFLPARVAVETDRKKGPGQSHPQAGEIMDHGEDNASSRPQDSVPWAVNRKPCIGLSGRKSHPVRTGV